MPIRTAFARWEGNLTDGSGTITSGSGGYQGSYSFASRFEEGAGVNPEELIAAAHSGCFSMALSNDLTNAGYTPTSVVTTAKVHLDKVDGGFGVTRIDLAAVAYVRGIDDDTFQKIAEGTRENCPISRLLSPGARISLDATLA
ncbi:OsmC family protein [Actinoplanes sp. NPDC026670]|uniref:OsmC family protein n=1 Tax=Actinoplanes sp. NPDC026670 TaxID=3154700 RepID=UPI0033EBC310